MASGHGEVVRPTEAAPTEGSRHHLGPDMDTTEGPTPEVEAFLRRLRAEMQEEVPREPLPLNLQPAPRRPGLMMAPRWRADVLQRLGTPSQGSLQQQEAAFGTAGWQGMGGGTQHDPAGYKGLLVDAGGQEPDPKSSMQAARTTGMGAERSGSSAVMNSGPGSPRRALPDWQAGEPARGEQGRPAAGWHQQPASSQALQLQLQHATSLDRLAAARAQLAAAAEQRAQQWAQLEALASGHVAQQQPGALMQAEGHASADVSQRQPPAGRLTAPRQAAAERKSHAAGSSGQQLAGGLQAVAISDATGSSEQQTPAGLHEPGDVLHQQQCPATEARQSNAATLAVQQAGPAAAVAGRDSANEVARQLSREEGPGAATWGAQPPAAELPAPAVTVTARDVAAGGAELRQAAAQGRSGAAAASARKRPSARHSPPRQPGPHAGSPADAAGRVSWPGSSLTRDAHETAAVQPHQSAACQRGAPQSPAAGLDLRSSCHEEGLAAHLQLNKALQGAAASACDLKVQHPEHSPALLGVEEESAATRSSPGSPAAGALSVDAPSTRQAASGGTVGSRRREGSGLLGTPGRAQQPSEAQSMPAHFERPVLTVGRAFALLGIQLDSGVGADSLRAAAVRHNAASLHAPLSVRLHAVQVRPGVMGAHIRLQWQAA